MTDKTTRRVRHKKRGTIYKVIGHARLQATGALPYDATLILYQGEDGHLWAREVSEFEDSRFENIAAPPDARHVCDYPMCSERGSGHPLACNCRSAL